MAAFAPEPFSLRRADRIIAEAFPTDRLGQASIRFTYIDDAGREVEASVFFPEEGIATGQYLADVARAINDIGRAHERLTDREIARLERSDSISPECRSPRLLHAAE